MRAVYTGLGWDPQRGTMKRRRGRVAVIGCLAAFLAPAPALSLPTSPTPPEKTSTRSSASEFNWQGSLKLLRGDPVAALADLDRAVELDPTYAPAYVNRSYVYNQLRQPQKALADAERAIQLDPGIPEAYFSRGVAHLQLGEREAAMADFRQALALFSQSGNFADQAILQQLLRQLGVE
ncbi:tetratricopeptide repeat protein [Synechococcus sp. H70.2]|uniref:tetratricopeptide repeat protein n=1 Tax=Synechococcus sp. H70.2 TaxID=2964528 RepID=UPI0039C00FC6